MFGVLTWIVASALFFLYVSNFSSYSATYGAFAAAVILLVWLWLTNVVLLFGAELNAVIDLRRSPELSDGYDGPPLPAKVPADSVGPSAAGRSVICSGQEHSVARPGHSPHSSRCGCAATGQRSASTPDGEVEQRVRRARARRPGVNVAETGSAGALEQRVGDLDARRRRR